MLGGNVFIVRLGYAARRDVDEHISIFYFDVINFYRFRRGQLVWPTGPQVERRSMQDAFEMTVFKKPLRQTPVAVRTLVCDRKTSP